MRTLLVLVSIVFLGGCIGNAPRQTEIAAYDFGSLSGSGPGMALTIPLANIDVRAASWLDSTAQLYRLNYADDLRRYSFTASRWAAPPAEMLERALQQRLVFGQPDTSGRGCRLAVALDEFEQHFATTEDSDMVLEVRVRLLAANGERLLAKRSFLVRQPATTPDARGGAMAARAVVQALADEMTSWLSGVTRKQTSVAAGCKAP